MRLPGRPSRAQILANHANAQLSTGPKTEEGKAAVSQNAWRHGLTGAFAVLPWESEEEYVQLALDLRAEHQPSTPTEALLVDRLAQHHWLMQRAITLQGNLMDKELPLCEYPMNLGLFMRYQTTHERAFHKCLAELAKLRAERRKNVNGFESQNRAANVNAAPDPSPARPSTPDEVCSEPLGFEWQKPSVPRPKEAVSSASHPTLGFESQNRSELPPSEPRPKEAICSPLVPGALSLAS